MGLREYKMQLIVNGVFCSRVLVDNHYETKHADTMSDELILELVKQLQNEECEVEEHMDYIGVVNAYRR